ncbi:natural killer cell receptor 2B4-like isoform X2 [Melanotaenia boesemani]|uniref:natural killer cell receptor 2B4-like isoform X2 n=1 Tax=Melanotaenia boesemani TaxID=1250792 RepID=UPI001C041E66|nr:natural killer cell receptor 2B4-like isoform X2 [Melanotaenia boesemani]
MVGRIVPLLALLAVMSGARAQSKAAFFAVGDPLVLKPPSQKTPITSITWKHKGNIVTEWIKDQLPLKDYGDFRNRTSLDLNTAELTIKNTTSADAGQFEVEINNKVLEEKYQAEAIKKVPKPEVILRTLTCTETSPSCNLSCGGAPERPELVSYSWKRGNGQWAKSDKNLNINNDEQTQAFETFSCKMENPVSQEESEPFKNPFFKPPPQAPVAGIVGGVIAVTAMVGAGVAAFFKRDKLKSMFSREEGAASPKDRENPAEHEKLKETNCDGH